ncbi:MAG: hypothetical protein LUO98_05190 [Methanoregula sp.]|nr:hypothetical protein [Methanoregula sp.]
MILRMYALTLEPIHPLRFSLYEFRSFLNKKLAEYSGLHRTDAAGFLHRYPVIQCKQVKGDLMVTGISQGADCLYQLSHDESELGAGESTCRITARDTAIRAETFGVTEVNTPYKFLTPWLALNQQNAKKFYDLQGKPPRDAFMQKLLTAQLNTLARSLDYDTTVPITCQARVQFRRERIRQENVMVFLGKFQTNLIIPDFLGIGQSVSQGYGTLKRITEDPKDHSGESA